MGFGETGSREGTREPAKVALRPTSGVEGVIRRVGESGSVGGSRRIGWGHGWACGMGR
jgi:hypothetical protein